MRAKNLVLSLMAVAVASAGLLFQAVLPKTSLAADLTVRVTQTDGRSTSKPTADVADGGTGGFKSATHTMDSTGYDGVDVGTDVPLNTTHRGLTTDPHSTVSDTHPPTATEAFSGEHVFDYLEHFNGTIIETVDVDIVEAAGTVSLELQADGGGDLTLNFSDGHHAFDATDPVASVALSNGDDEVPVKNYVYILQSNDTLTASAVDWPDAEHAPVATVVVQSAASVASVGPYAVQVWTDHIKDANDQGHLTDIADWIRSQHATWKSGVEPTLTITVIGGSDTVIFTSTTGEVYQLHTHDFPAFTGTPTIYVYNDNATPYNPITDLNQLTAISDGTAFSTNDYFTVAIWGVVSEDAADCKLYLNLPSGVYGNSTAALLDSSMFTNTSIPAIYKGSAFLIAQYTLRYHPVDGGTFTLVAGGDVDLRGQPPGTSTGGGAGGGSSLTVAEQDSSPSIPDVNTLKFDNDKLIDEGGGIVSVDLSGTPGGSTAQVQFNDSGSFGGDAGLTYDKTLDALYAAGWVYSLRFRLMDGDTNHIDFLSPALSTDWILTWPADDGDSGQVLETDGAGNTDWATPAGTGDMLKATYDTNTDGIIDLAASHADLARATGDTYTGTHDAGGATLELPNAAGSGTLGNAGEVHINSLRDAIAVHFGTGGEIAGEAQISALTPISVVLDPGAWYATSSDVFMFTIGDEAPNGITIDEWKCSCNVDPDVEIEANLRYANAWIGKAGSAIIDIIDTTNGTSSEDTDANINGGVAVANGKVIYLQFDADPEGTCEQMIFEMWYHAEED